MLIDVLYICHILTWVPICFLAHLRLWHTETLYSLSPVWCSVYFGWILSDASNFVKFYSRAESATMANPSQGSYKASSLSALPPIFWEDLISTMQSVIQASVSASMVSAVANIQASCSNLQAPTPANILP